MLVRTFCIPVSTLHGCKMLLTCKCLNIKLYIQGKEADFEQLKQKSKDEEVPTGFFPAGEVEVTLDTKGIKQEHGYLVHRRRIGNYMVFRCLNCNLETYALRDSGNQVIVSNCILSDIKVIDRLMKSGGFSKVFDIVLHNKDTPYTGVMPDPQKGAYESLQTHLNSITQQLANYLNTEEAEMEERIRNYEEAQKAEFEQLKTRLKEEKKQMISLVLSASQFESQTPVTETSKRTPTDRKSPAKKKLGRVKSLPPAMDDNDDALFSFDGGFADNQDATLYGEEPSLREEESDDDDVGNDDTFESDTPRARSHMKPKLTYSTSVPISVPSWGSKQESYFEDDYEEVSEDLPAEPNQIAASMQALAQSITDDNRYIFGERPRPRLNTGDFSMNR